MSKYLFLFIFLFIILWSCSEKNPYLKVGLVADPQYANKPTSGKRHYSETLWKLEEGYTLTPESPIVISWGNNNGLVFKQKISIDENYIFNIEQTIINNSPGSITVFPYQQLSRKEAPTSQALGLLHEGPNWIF